MNNIDITLDIRRNIKSCKTNHQLNQIQMWLLDLSRRRYLLRNDYTTLSGLVWDKWMELNGFTDSKGFD